MSDTLIVSAIQHPVQHSLEATRDYLSNAVADSAKAGARLMVLQELHNGPYFCQTEDVSCFDLAEPIPGPSTDFLGTLAREHQCVIVGSLFERRAAGLYHNTAVVLDTDGSLAGQYRKMHIPDDPGFYEKFYFTPGDAQGSPHSGFQPVMTAIGKLGVLVCWDQWYPEAARLMALAGAEILIYPTAIGWDPEDDDAEKQRQRDAWITIQRSHAIANNLPVVVCNRCGFEASPDARAGGISFWGNSFIAGQQGEFLAVAEDQPTNLIATVDMAKTEHTRRIWPYLRDRRVDAYQNLTRRYLDH